MTGRVDGEARAGPEERSPHETAVPEGDGLFLERSARRFRLVVGLPSDGVAPRPAHRAVTDVPTQMAPMTHQQACLGAHGRHPRGLSIVAVSSKGPSSTICEFAVTLASGGRI